MRIAPIFASLLAVPLSLATAAAGSQESSNDIPLNNNGDTVNFFSDPSVGFPVGTVPPDINGDLFWRVLPGPQVMAQETAGGSVMEIRGYYESLFDTYWGTCSGSSAPDFYDRSHGPALPSTSTPGLFEPAFFQLGWTSEVLISIGNSGFGPGPCCSFPSLCSPPGGTCPPSGFVNGYLVEIEFVTGVAPPMLVPADGTSASDSAVAWFVQGGMTATGGGCGLGDYGLQDVHSTDETQADVTGTGISPYSGFQLAGSGPIADAVTSMAEPYPTFRDPVLNVVADTGTGLGVEVGNNGGGATNGLNLAVGAGNATLGVELRSIAHNLTTNFAIVGSSLTPLATGVPAFGTSILIQPDALTNATSSIWQGSVNATVFVFTSEAAFTGVQLPVPASSAGSTIYSQGLVFDLAALTAASTNRVATRLLP